MKIERVSSSAGELSICRPAGGEKIRNASDFLDMLMSCPTGTSVLENEALPDAFFDLKTGFAGECLQKVSNYRRRLIILGDFGAVKSGALRDFIRESNREGIVVFAPDLDSGLGLLRTRS